MRRWLEAAKLFPSRTWQRLSGFEGARFDASLGEIALTFDDGPDPERTPRVLDVLAESGVRATFFVVGEKVQRFPELLKRIAREGHSIGNHSWSHRFLPRATAEELEIELGQTQAIIEEVAGVRPSMFRPPYGWGDPRVYAVAERLGLSTVLWSFDSFDYFGLPDAALEARLGAVRAGDVVLLHDGSPFAHATPRVLTGFLQNALQRGVRFEVA